MLWILQGHTIASALVARASMNYLPLLLYLKLLGLKAERDSSGVLSGCFLFEFTSTTGLFYPDLL